MAKKLPQANMPVYELKTDYRQADFEKFELELIGLPARLIMPSSSKYGGYLRAAIGVGWIVTPNAIKRTIEENGAKRIEYAFNGSTVDDMHPAIVWKLGKEIEDIYEGGTKIDPN